MVWIQSLRKITPVRRRPWKVERPRTSCTGAKNLAAASKSVGGSERGATCGKAANLPCSRRGFACARDPGATRGSRTGDIPRFRRGLACAVIPRRDSRVQRDRLDSGRGGEHAGNVGCAAVFRLAARPIQRTRRSAPAVPHGGCRSCGTHAAGVCEANPCVFNVFRGSFPRMAECARAQWRSKDLHSDARRRIGTRPVPLT
jgi:hypothetical protein